MILHKISRFFELDCYAFPVKVWVSSSLSPTIPTILTTRRSLPLSASRRTKRMLSQKERVETEGLAWWRALYSKEKNALIERAHRKEARC